MEEGRWALERFLHAIPDPALAHAVRLGMEQHERDLYLAQGQVRVCVCERERDTERDTERERRRGKGGCDFRTDLPGSPVQARHAWYGWTRGHPYRPYLTPPCPLVDKVCCMVVWNGWTSLGHPYTMIRLTSSPPTTAPPHQSFLSKNFSPRSLIDSIFCLALFFSLYNAASILL